MLQRRWWMRQMLTCGEITKRGGAGHLANCLGGYLSGEWVTPAAPAVPFLILLLICFTGKRPRAHTKIQSIFFPIDSSKFLCCFFLSTVTGKLHLPRSDIIFCFKARTQPYFIFLIWFLKCSLKMYYRAWGSLHLQTRWSTFLAICTNELLPSSHQLSTGLGLSQCFMFTVDAGREERGHALLWTGSQNSALV